MSHILGYALVKWQSSQIIGLISLIPNDNQINIDLQNALQFLQHENISQFQKIKYVSTSEGKWYYLPFNKEVIQLILASNDYNQENVEMLINSINAKIFDHNPSTPQSISIQQKQNIYNLLAYFDSAHNKEPKQIQQILQTLDNTKQTVQQNIERLINNKESLLNIEGIMLVIQLNPLNLKIALKYFSTQHQNYTKKIECKNQNDKF